MTKRNLLAVTTTCLNASGPLLVVCSLSHALRPFLDADPVRAFLFGLMLGVSIELPAIVLGISISEGEK